MIPVEFKKKYGSLNLVDSELEYVTRNLAHSEEQMIEFLDGLVRVNLLCNDCEVPLDSQMQLYQKSKKRGKLNKMNWSDLVEYMICVAESQDSNSTYSMLSSVVNEAIKIDTPWKVGSYISDNVSKEKNKVNNVVPAGINSILEDEDSSAFAVMQQTNFEPSKVNLSSQKSYRDDPLKDDSHLAEHIATQYLNNK